MLLKYMQFKNLYVYDNMIVFLGMSKFKTNNDILHHEMSELRVIKTEMELEVLRYVAEVSSAAHMYVMRNLKPGMREYQAEAMFRHYSYDQGGLFTFLFSCLFTFFR